MIYHSSENRPRKSVDDYIMQGKLNRQAWDEEDAKEEAEQAQRQAERDAYDNSFVGMVDNTVQWAEEKASGALEWVQSLSRPGATVDDYYKRSPQVVPSEGSVEALNVAAEVAGDVVGAVGNAIDSYRSLIAQGDELRKAFSPSNVQQALDSGDFSTLDQAVSDIQDSANDFGGSVSQVGTSFIKAPLREFVSAYGDDDGAMGDLAKSAKRSDAYINYVSTPEQKLEEARDIESLTGISAESILYDNDSFRAAQEVYDYAKKMRELGVEDINEVWKAFPELKSLAEMSPDEAALALHDFESVRRTSGIIESFTKMFERGSKDAEFNNLNNKLARGEATEADKERIEELRQELAKRVEAPSFFDDPAAFIAAGIGGSLPAMADAIVSEETARDFAIGAGVGAAATAITGPGAGAGALAAGSANALRGTIARIIFSTAVRRGASYGAQFGMFQALQRQGRGKGYAEISRMKDEKGDKLVTNEAELRADAELYGLGYAGANMIGIETLMGTAIKGGSTRYATEAAVKAITRQAQLRAGVQVGLSAHAKDVAANWALVTAGQSAQEGMESLASDLVHNKVELDTGDRSNHLFTAEEILTRAGVATAESLPVSAAFGVLGGAGSIPSHMRSTARSIKNLYNEQTTEEAATQKTAAGAIMLGQLRDVTKDSKLKKTAPDVQEKIIHDQIQGTGFEDVYVDTEMALQQEGGLEDLKAVAKAGGYSEEELQAAIDNKGHLMIPTEKFSQVEASDAIMGSVSFSPDADSLNRINARGKELHDAYEKLWVKAVDKQRETAETVAEHYFPIKGSEKLSEEERAQRALDHAMATAIIAENPSNPAKALTAQAKELTARKAELLKPALDALKRGMGQGVDIILIPGKDGERGVRVSNNAEWYQKFHSKYHRKPTNQELEDMAYALTIGDESAPLVAGWIPDSAETQARMAAAEVDLDYYNDALATLERIKPQLEHVNGVEMEMLEGVSPEAYRAYKSIEKQLETLGGEQAKAARQGAYLIARHADIMAKVEAKRTGKPYTAEDWVRDKVQIQKGEKLDKGENSFSQTTKGEINVYADGMRVISLFESADASTFLHESGHLFLLDLEDMAKVSETSAKELAIVKDWAKWEKGAAREYELTPWAKEFANREKAILAAEKKGDKAEADKLKRAWEHERFARGFELYLEKGKAPVRGLKAVFRACRKFLSDIYRAFKSEGGRATPQVEAIMARMVATEDEMDAAGFETELSEADRKGIFPYSDADYQRLMDSVREEAKEKLMASLMKDLKGKKREEFEKCCEEEETDFRRKLSQEPVYLAENAYKDSKLKTAVTVFGFKDFAEYEALRASVPDFETVVQEHMDAYRKDLDQRLIDTYLSDENIAKAMRSAEYAPRLQALEAAAFKAKAEEAGKLQSPAERAKQNVLDKIKALPDDAVLDLANESPEMKEIAKAIRQLQFSAKWRPSEFKKIRSMINAKSKKEIKEALDSVKESAREVKEHIRDVEKATEGRIKQIKKEAEESLASRRICEATAYKAFRREEKNLGRQVLKFIRQGKWQEAYDAKMAQARASALVAAAEKQQKAVEKILSKQQKNLKSKTAKLPAQEKYWLHHLAYQLGLEKQDAATPADGVAPIDTVLAGLKESHDLEDDISGVLDVFSDETYKDYKSLTIGQLEDIANVMSTLYTTGKLKNNLVTVAGKTIDQALDEITSYKVASPKAVSDFVVNDNKGGLFYNDIVAMLPVLGEKMARGGQRAMSAMMKPEIFLGLINENAHRYIYGTYERAAEKKSAMTADSIRQLNKILEPFGNKERRAWKKRDIRAENGEMLSKENIICAALNLGNPQNRQRLLGGIGNKFDIIELVNKHMTKKDWKMVQELWDFVDQYWDDTCRVEEKLNGRTLKKVPAEAFDVTLEDGEVLHMRGGYYPIKYNAGKSDKAGDQSLDEAARRNMSGAQRLGAGRGFTKSRSDSDIVGRPLLLEFGVLTEHVAGVIQNISTRLAARDVYKLVNNKRFSDFIKKNYGDVYHASLKEWALDVWNEQPAVGNEADKLIQSTFDALRRNGVMGVMGYRIWPAVENISNISVAMDRLGAARTITALGDYYRHMDEYDHLLARSSMMSDRINSLDRDIKSNDALFNPSYTPFEIIKSHAYDLMVKSDLMVSKPVWCAAYKDCYLDKLGEVKHENEQAKARYEEAQANVDKLRGQLRDAQSGRLQDMAQGSPFDVGQAEAMGFNADAIKGARQDVGKTARSAFKELQKRVWQAEIELENAIGTQILTDDEIAAEAEHRAILQADRAVREIMGSGDTKDLSSVLRSKRDMVKLLTTFMSFFNTQFNALVNSYARGVHANGPVGGWHNFERYAPFARSLMYRVVFVGLIGGSLKYALGIEGGDDKDKYKKVKGADGKETEVEVPWLDRYLKVQAKNILSTATGMIPILRDFGNTALNYCFDGKTYGDTYNPMSVAGQGITEAATAISLLAKKGEKDLEIQAKQAKEKEKIAKMKPEARKKYLENQKYKKPDKPITYSEIMRHASRAAVMLPGPQGATQTGITDTLTDAIWTTMMYMNDGSNRYDPSLKNIVWSAIFDKKPVEREIPKKPKKENKK